MGEDAGLLVARLRDFERPPGVPFQIIQFGTDRAAGVLFYLTPGGAKIRASMARKMMRE